MGLSITALGTAGSYAGPGDACSGYLVRHDSTAVWLDAGPGTLANLQRHVELTDVDAVVLTHAHPDHWTDVNGFYVACKWYVGRRHVPVYSPGEVADLARRFHPELAPTFDWRVVTERDEVAVDGMRLRFSRTDHPVETLAVRFDAGGRSLVYSADTGPDWSMTSLGAGIDLALCEATMGDGAADTGARHLSARQAGEMAGAAGAQRLLVTHLPPGADPDESRAQAAAAFSGPVEVAVTNARYEV